jgi:lipopolysaccharide transport system ATP-binding protein
MAEPVVIDLNHVSKRFRCYDQPVDRLKELLLPHKPRGRDFWALQEINLSVRRGETVGIIGQNGSGKSTLLQIIAGTLQPTTGDVQVQGRVSALLELGSGFNPEFTGRQNVFFNGRILGLTQAEIEQKFDEIAAFADIGDFLEQPVKTYSSGMFVRLAFAVAVNVDPTILIVDEALAVGDIYFQQKCFERLRQLKEAGNTLLFVSHDASAIYKLCSRAVLLEHGHVLLDSRPRQVLDLYEAKLWRQLDQDPESLDVNVIYGTDVPTGDSEAEDVIVGMAEPIEEVTEPVEEVPKEVTDVQLQRSEVTIQAVTLLNADGQRIETPVIDQLVRLVVQLHFRQDFEDPHVGFKIRDRTGLDVFAINTHGMHQTLGPVVAGEALEVTFDFCLRLIEGEYTVTIGIANGGYGYGQFRTVLAYVHSVLAFKVLREPDAPIWGGIVSLNPTLGVQRRPAIAAVSLGG